MADTFGGGTFGSGTGTQSTTYRFPSFRQVEDEQDDITKQPLFQQAQQVAGQQLGGQVEGFDAQANEARDAFKAAQAASARATREQLMGFGMRDTGQYITEGIIGPADKEIADRNVLERNLASMRQDQIRAQQTAGMTGAGTLLGLQQEQQGIDLQKTELYGFDDPTTGKHTMGTLELQGDSNAIARQGMEIDEAKAFGYTDDSGVYHEGSLAIERAALNLDNERFNADYLALFGGTDANGNVVKGTSQIAAEKLGLEGETVELQRQELFGGYDEQGNWMAGKYQMMNAEQQREADELYGYFDKATGEYVPGKFDQAKIMLQLENTLEIELTKAGIDYAVVMEQLQNLDGDQAGAMIKDIAAEYGIDIPSMTDTRKEAEATALATYQNQRVAGDGYAMSEDMIEALKSAAAQYPNSIVPDPGNTFESMGINKWVDGFGVANHWTVSDAAREWANSNVGKLYSASNGHLYEIVGIDDKDERHYRAGIQFRDLQTGALVTLKDGSGFPAATMAGV